MEKKIIKTDLAVIGAGPAGVTAAIYAKRAGLSPVVFENGVTGGQVAVSSVVENYPGFTEISGAALAERFREHLSRLGVEIEEFDPIEGTELSEESKIIRTESKIYEASAVIIASGASPKPLPLKSGEKFRGRGVHYCALCDGSAYSGRTVGVVGGGSAALEEALYLSRIAERVVIIRRKSGFHAEKAILERVKNVPNIDIMYNADLVDVDGGGSVEYALIRRSDEAGGLLRLPLSAVFGYIGTAPKTDFLDGSVAVDSGGYILTDEDMRTNIGGVFAAGDVRKKRYRQIVTAVSDGAAAALNAEKYISGKKCRPLE